MKLIGITSNIDNQEETTYVNNSYINAFTSKDYTPLVIPNFTQSAARSEIGFNISEEMTIRAKEIVSLLDVLVVTGGVDINPVVFGLDNESSYNIQYMRDLTEIALFKEALQQEIPIMGICRGLQLIGNVIGLPNFQQELSGFGESHSGSNQVGTRYEPFHSVKTRGAFKDFCDLDTILVNSFHHQGFTFHKDKPTLYNKMLVSSLEAQYGIEVLAHTDQVVEAFQIKDKPVFAVQWHPEELGNESKTIKYFFEKVCSRIKIPIFE